MVRPNAQLIAMSEAIRHQPEGEGCEANNLRLYGVAGRLYILTSRSRGPKHVSADLSSLLNLRYKY